MRPVAENLWIMRFPLAVLGAQIGRTVTLIRLRSGEIVIHSTAPFMAEHLQAIKTLGEPAWLVEATLLHDTLARRGRLVFPKIPYLAPEGFKIVETQLLSAPPAWTGEIDMILLEGMPKIREHVFFHRPSRTLIVADLVFNFGVAAPPWTKFVFRYAAGITSFPGMSRYFKLMIRDREAFKRSIARMMEWDFDRLIVAHGDIVEHGAKTILQRALSAALR